MMRDEGRAGSGGQRTGPENTPRLRLKPQAPITGHVDGAWWPRSGDLPSELPDLLAVLSVRLGPIDRVMYHLAEWATMPAQLQIGGRAVRLDGFNRQPANTLEVLGLSREKVLLLVIPPNANPDLAHDAMMTAAAPNDVTTIVDILESARLGAR
jgi:Family of unknown function (DUF5994)